MTQVLLSEKEPELLACCLSLSVRCQLLFRPSYVMKVQHKLRKNTIENFFISVLVASGKILECEERILPSNFYGQLPDYQCPTTLVSHIYVVDELYIFQLLVLLNEMSTRSETKISSCYFCVWSKLRKLGGRESPRFPRVTPVVKNFSAHLL